MREHGAWLDRLRTRYGLPRAVLLKMLDRPGALEDEIAGLIVELATDRARALFADDEPPPDGEDLYSRAVRGVLAQMVARKQAADRAEQLKRYAATDELLRRMKAGEDV